MGFVACSKPDLIDLLGMALFCRWQGSGKKGRIREWRRPWGKLVPTSAGPATDSWPWVVALRRRRRHLRLLVVVVVVVVALSAGGGTRGYVAENIDWDAQHGRDEEQGGADAASLRLGGGSGGRDRGGLMTIEARWKARQAAHLRGLVSMILDIAAERALVVVVIRIIVVIAVIVVSVLGHVGDGGVIAAVRRRGAHARRDGTTGAFVDVGGIGIEPGDDVHPQRRRVGRQDGTGVRRRDPRRGGRRIWRWVREAEGILDGPALDDAVRARRPVVRHSARVSLSKSCRTRRVGPFGQPGW